MSKSWALRVAVLMVWVTVAGVLAVHGAPDDGRGMGIWPVGLAAGTLLLDQRRRVPWLLALVYAIAVLTIWQGGRPLDVAIGFAAGIVVEIAVVWALVTRGTREAGPARLGAPDVPGLRDLPDVRPTLRTVRQLAVYLSSCLAGALAAAAVAALTSVAVDWGRPGVVALTIGTAHLGSLLTLLPFFMRLHTHGALGSRAERLAQWLLVATVTPLVFLPTNIPPLVFLVIPILGWGALRVRPREALLQMAAVLGFAIIMTTAGLGPFAAAPAAYGLPIDVRGIVLATFAITCALVVVPLMLTVGEQVESARQAEAERDRLQNIVKGATGVAIIGTDASGDVSLFNPGAERLLGYSAAEMMGGTTRHLHSASSIAAKARELGVAADFATVALELTKPENAGSPMAFLRKDGVERTHAITLTRMVDDRGRLLGHVSTSEDVTERIREAAALELALETEREAVERLQEVDAVKDAFVSSVSHELRTPITSILGYLEMLEDGSYGGLNPGQLDAVERVAGNSSRLLGLIDDLLTLSRVDRDGMGLIERAFDLREVVSSGYGVVAPAWKMRDLSVELALPLDPVPFTGDKDMVERIVVNLLGNAVKFTPEGGRVDVALTVDGTDALLVVSDTGIGIPAQEQDRLFTRFFRSTNAQRQAIPGSGLGLSITRAIVEKHGGRIDVESVADQGSAFRVRMPVVT